jgi:hypothetical protein
MSPNEGEEQPPPLQPSIDEATFIWLLLTQGKKKEGGVMPKFVKNLEEILVIDLPSAQPMSVVVSLADQALFGQFTGLWTSPQTAEN